MSTVDLVARRDVVARRMSAIQNHPGHQRLRDGPVSGTTKAIWDALRPRIAALWSQFNALRDHLDAGEARSGPVVALDARGLVCAGDPVLTLAELADRLDTDQAAVIADLDRVATATARLNDVLVLVERTREKLAAADALIDEIRDLVRERQDRLRAEADSVRARVDTSDPLGSAPPDLDALSRAVTELEGVLGVVRKSSGDPDRRPGDLRGRLRAYQARATALGVAEEPAVRSRYADAYELTHAEPCDLSSAERAVTAFARAVSEAGAGHG